MELDQIKTCEKLIRCWQKEKDLFEKEKIRNEIYKVIHPSMIQWIYSIIRGKGVYLTEEEIISKSWDCFLFCLKHFSFEKRVPIPNHFYSYTKFKLSFKRISREFGPQKNEMIPEKPEREFISDNSENVYIHIEELKKFRGRLPDELQPIFDDAIMSMAPYKLERTVGQTIIKGNKYNDAKRILKIVIDFLLSR